MRKSATGSPAASRRPGAYARRGVPWLALAVPPFVWGAHGLLGWFVAASACAPQGTLSMETARWLLGALTVAALAATIIAAWRAAARLRGDGGRGLVPERERFMAFSAVLVSLSLTLGVILGGVPALFIQECGFSR